MESVTNLQRKTSRQTSLLTIVTIMLIGVKISVDAHGTDLEHLKGSIVGRW